MLHQSNFTGSDAIINIHHLKVGVYVLRFEIEGEVVTKRLVMM